MPFEMPNFEELKDDLQYTIEDTPDRIQSWAERNIADAQDFLNLYTDAEDKKNYIAIRDMDNLDRVDDVISLAVNHNETDLLEYYSAHNARHLPKEDQVKLYQAAVDTDFPLRGDKRRRREQEMEKQNTWDHMNEMPEAQWRNADIVTTEVSTKPAAEWDRANMLRMKGLNKDNLDYIYSFVETPEDQRAWLEADPESTRPNQEVISTLFKDDLDALYNGGVNACTTDVLSYGRSILDNEKVTDKDLNYLVGTLEAMVKEYNPIDPSDRKIVFCLTHKLRIHSIHQKNSRWEQEADRLRNKFTSRDTPDEDV